MSQVWRVNPVICTSDILYRSYYDIVCYETIVVGVVLGITLDVRCGIVVDGALALVYLTSQVMNYVVFS